MKNEITNHNILSVLIENEKSLFEVVFRVAGFPDLNLKGFGETEQLAVLTVFTDLCCHVFHQLGVVHHPTPVVINVSQEVSHLVICWEHS